jgi:hypothetical protein
MQRQRVHQQQQSVESQHEQQRAEEQRQHQLAEQRRQYQLEEERRQHHLEEERAAQLASEELKARQLEEFKEREREVAQAFEKRQVELQECLNTSLAAQGYMPPEPSPLVLTRTLKALTAEFRAHESDPVVSEILAGFEVKIEQQFEQSSSYAKQIAESLTPSFFERIKQSVVGIHESINRAKVSIELPNVAPDLQRQMMEIEVFLAKEWSAEKHRGVLAVHVDEMSKSTIIQIGVAEHGPIYITIPEILKPEAQALKSIEEALKRLAPFTGTVDPMAIIDGKHQKLNYNEIFLKSRVYRAPSGNTARLARNLQETARRERLSKDNTVILNSAPKSEAEYVRVFAEDAKAVHWAAWGSEAQDWNTTAAANRFDTAQTASQEALLTALTQTKNVIVIVAHCDGESIFMPEPPPTGSIVTADYLREHQDEIAANAPFVYLFSCKAGDLKDLENFASTLLDCGAAGVVASQSEVVSDEGRSLLGRILDEGRGAPPIEDYFNAMQDVNFREMEVFLA